MHCPRCRVAITHRGTHCTACGAVLPVTCPACEEIISPRAKFCSACGHQLLARDAERRQLTVLFCDLVGSTEAANRVDQEEWRAILDAIFGRAAEVVRRYNGFVSEYVGDGALAYFGYPDAHENDAECAIRAALEVVDKVTQMRFARYEPRIRVGIASGFVVVGATDLPGLRSAAGPTPNLAARLQPLADPGTVVIAPSTRALAGEMFEYRDRGFASLKGFSEPVRVWQVLGPKAIESRFEAHHQAGLTAMVGRDAELAQLWERWCEAREGNGRAVLLGGEPGIGKSRLTAMLMQRLAGEPHIRLRYFCSPHLQGSPLHPCIEQLERAARFVRGDSPARRLELLEAALQPSAPDPEDVALIADLLSLPTGDKYPKLHMTAQKRKEKTMEAMLRQLESLSRTQPVLMIFEDAHWSDPTSRDLLDLSVEPIARHAILLIVTHRPEFGVAWNRAPHVSRMTLAPLDRAASVKLVQGIPGVAELPIEVVDDIVERADGVPLYLEELTTAVVEGDGYRDGEQRVAEHKPHYGAAVPSTLHASLMTRLDRLGEAKGLAQIGAALGREFSHELLAAVAEMDEPQLRAGLEKIIRTGLMFRNGTLPNATYLFKHALVQDVAYDTMLRAKRQRLHERIARALEEGFPETKDVQPELLAHHYTEAGLVEKAIGYWLKAGVRALTRFTMQEALTRLGAGLKLVETLPETPARHRLELDFHIARGKALIATKGYAAQMTGETFARAYQLCERLDRPPQLLSVQHGQWTHALLRGDLGAARRRAEELLAQAAARNDDVWTLMGCRFMGVTCYPLGEFAAGRDHLARGLRLFDAERRSVYAALTVDDAQVVMLTYMAYVLLYLGDVDQARQRAAEALDKALELAQPYSLTHALIGCAYLEYYLGRPQAALGHLARLLALTSEHGIAYYAAVGAIFRGACLAAAGQVDEGIDTLRRGLADYRATGSILYMPSWLTLLAGAHVRAGQFGEALRLTAEALDLIETTGMRNDESETHRLRGEVLAAVRDFPAAEASFAKALEVAQRQQAKLLALRAATQLAKLWRDQGRSATARQMLAPVYERFNEGHELAAYREAAAVLDMVH